MMEQTCKICGKSFVNLRPHLVKHKITWREYEQQYNEKIMECNMINKMPKNERIEHCYKRENYIRLTSRK